MKTTLKLLVIIVAMGIWTAGARAQEKETDIPQDDWDILLKKDISDFSDLDSTWQPSHRGRHEGFGPRADQPLAPFKGHGPKPTRRSKSGHRLEPVWEKGKSPPSWQMGSGRRRGKNRVSIKELQAFLKEHEPQLAESMGNMRKDDPRAFRRKIIMLNQLFTPVIRQMKNHPEMAKLSLEKIHLKLKIEKELKKVKAVIEEEIPQSEKIKEAKNQLRQLVTKLFDLIVSQEDLRIKKWQQRAEEWSAQDLRPDRKERGPTKSEKIKNTPQDTQRTRRMKPDRSSGRLENRLAKKKALVENWQKNKKKIVNQHIQILLQGIKPFPWK